MVEDEICDTLYGLEALTPMPSIFDTHGQPAVSITDDLTLFGLHPVPDILTEEPGVLLATTEDQEAYCTACASTIDYGLPMQFDAASGAKHLHCWINKVKAANPEEQHPAMARLWFAAFKLALKLLAHQTDTGIKDPCPPYAKEYSQ